MPDRDRTTAGSRPPRLKLNGDALLQSVGLAQNLGSLGYGAGLAGSRGARRPEMAKAARLRSENAPGDPSVIQNDITPKVGMQRMPDMRFVTEVLSATQHKLAAAQRQF